MADEWYYKVNEQVSGPFTRDRLEKLGHSRAFGPGDWIRRGVGGTWVKPGAGLFTDDALREHAAAVESQSVPAPTTTDEEVRMLRREVEQIRQSPLISEPKSTLIIAILVSHFVAVAVWWLLWYLLMGPAKQT